MGILDNIRAEWAARSLTKRAPIYGRAAAWTWAYSVLEDHAAKEPLLNYLNWAMTKKIQPTSEGSLQKDILNEKQEIRGKCAMLDTTTQGRLKKWIEVRKAELEPKFESVMARRVRTGHVQDYALLDGFNAVAQYKQLNLVLQSLNPTISPSVEERDI